MKRVKWVVGARTERPNPDGGYYTYRLYERVVNNGGYAPDITNNLGLTFVTGYEGSKALHPEDEKVRLFLANKFDIIRVKDKIGRIGMLVGNADAGSHMLYGVFFTLDEVLMFLVEYKMKTKQYLDDHTYNWS